MAKLPKGGVAKLDLQNTCYVPNSDINLISKDDGGRFIKDIIARKKVILTGKKGPDRLYHLDTPSSLKETSYSTKPLSDLEKLHLQMGHLNYAAIKAMVRKNLATGISLSEQNLQTESPICAACVEGKMTRASFPLSKSERNPHILGLVHLDLWGPAPIHSLHKGSRYTITFTDDNSRWVWVYFLRLKSKAFSAFKVWLAEVEKETGKTLKVFRTDNGPEYLTKEWIAFMKEQGVAYTIWLKNQQFTSALPNLTPYEVYRKKKPDLSRAHHFGCRAFLYNNLPKRSKLDPRAEEVIFLGFSLTQKAWEVYRPKTKQCASSVHVRFDDITVGTSSSLLLSEGENDYSSIKNKCSPDEEEVPPLQTSPTPSSSSTVTPSVDIPQIAETPPLPSPNPPLPDPKPKHAYNKRPLPPPRELSTRQSAACGETVPSIPPSGSSSGQPSNSSIPFPTAESGPEPQAEADSSANPSSGGESSEAEASLITEHKDNWKDFALHISTDEPRTVAEAKASPDWPHWEAAMEREHEAILCLGTYSLGELPPGRKAIGSKWVFRKKRGLNGETIYKARIVAQGFSQIPGVDFFQTYAPVVRIETIWLLMAIAAINDWEFHVVDVDSAFLNSLMPADQTAYMKQPPGLNVEGKEDLVWILFKALYGLRQSAYLWYQCLLEILTKLGFSVLKSDPCIFIRQSSTGITIISAHVDDSGLFCTSISEVELVKSQIREHVSIKDQGEAKSILGMDIIRDCKNRTITLSHHHLIDKVVKDFNMQDAKPVHSPMNASSRLAKADSPFTPKERAEMRKIPYQEAVGSLMHIAVNTRPDIAFAVQQVAQFMSNPGQPHWKAVKRIIAYFKTTRDLTLTLGGRPSSQSAASPLIAYSDSDHCNSHDHARSISGFGLFYGQGAFSWSAKKQTSTATSTGEAELYAGLRAGTEITWIRSFLFEISLEQKSATTLKIDNNFAISMMDPPSNV
ncbi:hypothetical protein GALMADRAFT_146848 [Galerina marginata CBS 339.88]|uniref:Integrase catalytic domain-containing protein n=1 Tax=Galerina marginata (strain CBS 339.88) TaxID=685588 RepID=A0A067SM25_GALM3|nr:hypothetical protein GALMADRAFT_146848 [Galerina marginata CBS 339.88]